MARCQCRRRFHSLVQVVPTEDAIRPEIIDDFRRLDLKSEFVPTPALALRLVEKSVLGFLGKCRDFSVMRPAQIVAPARQIRELGTNPGGITNGLVCFPGNGSRLGCFAVSSLSESPPISNPPKHRALQLSETLAESKPLFESEAFGKFEANRCNTAGKRKGSTH